MARPAAARVTERLRLEPITPDHARDLWVIHNDDRVAPWYDGRKPTVAEAEEQAVLWHWCWQKLGVHKWMAYDRESGDLVGRGGLSPTPADHDWGRICAFLGEEEWPREAVGVDRAGRFHANWLEIGWALRGPFWGQGYASEIGRAGLDFAFSELGMRAVVSCTAHSNLRSRAVMERIGMSYAGLLADLDGGEDMVVHVIRSNVTPEPTKSSHGSTNPSGDSNG